MLIDIHCHMLPYVDDGASNLDESIRLIRHSAEQGVRAICLTPHLRAGMFETPDETIISQFRRIYQMCAEQNIPVKLFLSREYHFDRLYLSRLKTGGFLPIGKSNVILTEFSGRNSFAEILSAVKKVRDVGYLPLIAHVERYPALDGSVDRASELISAGALLQVNADSLLGKEGRAQKKFALSLAKSDLIYAVASDAHGMEFRPSNLVACSEFLTKKIGKGYTQKVMCKNPLNILNPGKGD